MNMKLSLLAISLTALGGCVAPGYDYVQPGYSGADGYSDSGAYSESGASSGYYTGGYYDGVGGYYSDYYDGCCDPASVSIGFGDGYGYPGYYDWGNYPYGYYDYSSYYDYYRHPYHHDWKDQGNPGGIAYDVHIDPAVQRWPNAQRSRVPDRPRVPHWNTMAQPGGQTRRPQMEFPQIEFPQAGFPQIDPSRTDSSRTISPQTDTVRMSAPHFEPPRYGNQVNPDAPTHEPTRSWAPPKPGKDSTPRQ